MSPHSSSLSSQSCTWGRGAQAAEDRPACTHGQALLEGATHTVAWRGALVQLVVQQEEVWQGGECQQERIKGEREREEERVRGLLGAAAERERT